MSKHLLLRNGFGGDIAGKIVLLDNPGAAIIYAMRGGARFRLSANFFSNDTGHPDAAVEFVLVPEPARQADGRDAEIAKLRESLAIFVHAHATGNSVPPHLEEQARSLVEGEAA